MQGPVGDNNVQRVSVRLLSCILSEILVVGNT